MREALLLGVCVCSCAAIAPPCDAARGSKAVCDDFCNHRCSFYNRSMGDTGAPKNITLYRLTPTNVTGLRNKNTGDPPGDVSYWLGKKNITRECAANPKAHGCIDNGAVIYGKFTVEVDGQFGPYLQCNPKQLGGVDPVLRPVWKDTRDFACGQDCLIATGAGCHSLDPRGKANGSSTWGGLKCYCDGTGRDDRTVGKTAPPFLAGQTYAPAAWAPQCKTGYMPAPAGHCLWGRRLTVLRGWSFDSALALACKACSTDSRCAGWRTVDNRSAELLRGPVVPVPARGRKCTGAWATPWSRHPSWFGVGDLGGLWYSTPSAGECPRGAPLGTGGCTWREVASLYKNSSCVDGRVDAAVEAFGTACFRRCSSPLNHTSDCYLSCYRSVLMGDSAINMTKIPDAQIIEPWVRAFHEEDPRKGGCPPLTPSPCDGPQCDPLLASSGPSSAIVV